jgi:hypothetical protein
VRCIVYLQYCTNHTNTWSEVISSIDLERAPRRSRVLKKARDRSARRARSTAACSVTILVAAAVHEEMTMLRRTGALLVAALPATASAASWTRGTGAVSVTVDSGTFAYSVALSDSLQDDAIADAATCGGFEGGGIEFRCDGVLYTHGGTASAGTALKLAAAPAESTGADRLGSFDSISASFEGGSSAACALFAEIRYYSTTESFVFAADFAPQPVPRVNSTELFTDGTDCPRCPQGSGKKCNGYCVEDMPGLATAFPTWPQGGAASECEYYSYAGNSLGGNWRAGLLSTWSGGMEAGPLLLYPAGSSAFHPCLMSQLPRFSSSSSDSSCSSCSSCSSTPPSGTQPFGDRLAFGVALTVGFRLYPLDVDWVLCSARHDARAQLAPVRRCPPVLKRSSANHHRKARTKTFGQKNARGKFTAMIKTSSTVEAYRFAPSNVRLGYRHRARRPSSALSKTM